MLTVIAYSALFIALISTILALAKYRQFYWVSAIGIYIFSFIAGFSIGQLTVGLTFVFLTLAIGHSFGWDTGKVRNLILVGIGFIIGIVAVLFIDDEYLFYPMKIFL
ncbi:hypothetical protein SD70_31955 [Gordoniibacillus kamchatkensis]|uniref:Uncharacterized protein n=1 Tax=Gordoniibacillus kamchatkensis TaxID=1590651 RepID=A0ABR5A3U0_9BACL|nr:hypothetical protein [Paenibacillus sp. VKM B-2647]KIL35731.1 hypothetical protein SD70_31955 [Paenibacillus sp. VKM B-2647]